MPQVPPERSARMNGKNENLTNSKLGKIERCDVKEIWPNEAGDFTPWLAQEENISELADAIGLELEIENVEVAVGPYSADILAKDTGSGEYVVIENQLGKTNHDHLGKLITYGSVLNATAIVWIASEFTEEHQKALEWLNDNTTESLSFFGVQVEIWRIGNSKPAVKFNVISRPAEMARQAAKVRASENLTETRKLQLDFWTAFRDKLLEEKVVASAHTPRPQYWFDVPVGRSNFVLSNIANTSEGRIGVRLYMSRRVADQAISQLMEQKEQIEGELGVQLMWNPHPEKSDKIIAVYRTADMWKRAEWDNYVAWLVDMVSKFRRVFMPRIKRLNFSN